jgi:putative sterol carrier protein
VAAFLSPQWLSALDVEARQVAAPDGLAPGQRIVLEQEVHDAPDGVVRYQLVVDDEGVHVVTPPASAADLTFVCDYATAAALAQATTNAQEALMGGRLRLRGDVERFSVAREVLLALGDMFARVRATTEF